MSEIKMLKIWKNSPPQIIDFKLKPLFKNAFWEAQKGYPFWAGVTSY